ncbi:hypothetical protein ACROYT_G001724 [Oculina patagonica]
MPTAPMLCWKPSSCIALYSVEFLLRLPIVPGGRVVVTEFDDGGDRDRSQCKRTLMQKDKVASKQLKQSVHSQGPMYCISILLSGRPVFVVLDLQCGNCEPDIEDNPITGQNGAMMAGNQLVANNLKRP